MTTFWREKSSRQGMTGTEGARTGGIGRKTGTGVTGVKIGGMEGGIGTGTIGPGATTPIGTRKAGLAPQDDLTIGHEDVDFISQMYLMK